MASEVVTAREGSINPINAQRGAVTRQNALRKAGFQAADGTYTLELGDSSISLREYETRQGEKRYSAQVHSDGNMRTDSYSADEVRKLARKFGGLSSWEARSVVSSYVSDLFNPRLTRTEGDALKLRKKYLGF